MFYSESSLIHPDGVYWPGTIVAGMLASEYSILMCDIAAGSLLTNTPALGWMLVHLDVPITGAETWSEKYTLRTVKSITPARSTVRILCSGQSCQDTLR